MTPLKQMKHLNLTCLDPIDLWICYGCWQFQDVGTRGCSVGHFKKIVPLGSCPIWGQMSRSNISNMCIYIYNIVSVAYLHSFIYYRGISASFMHLDELVKANPNININKTSTLSRKKKKRGKTPSRLLFLLLEFSQLLCLVRFGQKRNGDSSHVYLFVMPLKATIANLPGSLVDWKTYYNLTRTTLRSHYIDHNRTAVWRRINISYLLYHCIISFLGVTYSWKHNKNPYPCTCKVSLIPTPLREHSLLRSTPSGPPIFRWFRRVLHSKNLFLSHGFLAGADQQKQ